MKIEKKVYRNVFLELGLGESEIDKRVQDTFNAIFYGKNNRSSSITTNYG